MFLGKFCNEDFMTAFEKLTSLNNFMHAPVIFRLVDAGKIIKEEFRKYVQTRDKLLEQYADRDDKNELIRRDVGGNATEFSFQKHGDEFLTAMRDLDNTDVSIPVFSWSELRQRNPVTKEEYDAPLSPRDLISLGDLIKP